MRKVLIAALIGSLAAAPVMAEPATGSATTEPGAAPSASTTHKAKRSIKATTGSATSANAQASSGASTQTPAADADLGAKAEIPTSTDTTASTGAAAPSPAPAAPGGQ